LIVVAETRRLIIRHFTINDAEAMVAIFGDAIVMRFSDDGVQSPEFARVWVANMMDYYSIWGFGMWAIVQKETQGVIGYAGVSRFAGRCGPDEAELGFRLARPYWGRGYATEASGAACEYGLGELLLPRIVAIIDPDNVSSIRVAKKIGMTFESEVMLPGYTHPDHLYAIAR
jgi:[ribosomal protein S5]-alanine N-acetyltransferase